MNDGGPAFPCPVGHSKCEHPEGMSIRQYAAIKLRVPESGTPWLDAMIRESLRNEFAGQALSGLLASQIHGMTNMPSKLPFATIAYDAADAMLAEQSRRENV